MVILLRTVFHAVFVVLNDGYRQVSDVGQYWDTCPAMHEFQHIKVHELAPVTARSQRHANTA